MKEVERSDQFEPRRRRLRKIATNVAAAIWLSISGGADTGRSDQLEPRRRRLRGLALSTSVAAVILLFLSAGVASAAQSDSASTLVLEELVNGQVQCVSPDATCTSVNLYAQNNAPGPAVITPGQQNSTTVQFRNAGTLAASSLDISAATCQNQPVSGVGAPGGDLCGTVIVTFLCTTGGSTFSYGPTTLTAFAQSGTHTVNSGLAPGDSTTCRFTVTYPANGPLIFSTSAVQPITKTLTAAGEVPPRPTPTTPAPPTTTPSVVAPVVSVPPSPPSPAVPAPSVSVPPSVFVPPSTLPSTGTDALALGITGLALLAMGAMLFLFSRRRDRGSPAGDSR